MEQKAISSDLIRGHIDTIILHTLLDGDKFAQQISDAVKSKSNGEYELNQATLYSCLKRLENLKYVTGYWHDSDSGRRRYFKITDAGKELVEGNLSNWSYSRSIIDKLMDFEPQEVVRTQVVEKEVVKIQYVEKPVEIPAPTPIIEQNVVQQEKPILSQPEIMPKIAREENIQEINFRNILNGLIKSSKKQSEIIEDSDASEYVEEKKEKENLEAYDKKVEVKKFNETISSMDYKVTNNNFSGKIDFGDLAIQANKEGYKLRISNRDEKILTGSYYVNKINLWASMLVFLVAMLETLFFTVVKKSALNVNGLIVLLIVFILAIYPIVKAVIFFRNPSKTCKKIKADTILTTAIVVFNLILVTFALNLLFNVNLSHEGSLLTYFIIPTVLFVDSLLYFIIRYFIASKNGFKVKQSEKKI